MENLAVAQLGCGAACVKKNKRKKEESISTVQVHHSIKSCQEIEVWVKGQYKVGIWVCLPCLLLFWLICCHCSLVLMLYEERHLSYSPSPQVALCVYNYNFGTLSISTGIQPRGFFLTTPPTIISFLTYAEFLCLSRVSRVIDKILRVVVKCGCRALEPGA